MTPRFAALLAHHYPAKPSTLPRTLTLFGAVVTAIGVLLFVTAKSFAMMIAAIVVAPIGMFPLFIGGVLWAFRGTKRAVEEKVLLAAGAYGHVEAVRTEVYMNGFKSHDAYVVRVHAVGDRTIDLSVHESDVASTLDTLREHVAERRAA